MCIFYLGSRAHETYLVGKHYYSSMYLRFMHSRTPEIPAAFSMNGYSVKCMVRAVAGVEISVYKLLRMLTFIGVGFERIDL